MNEGLQNCGFRPGNMNLRQLQQMTKLVGPIASSFCRAAGCLSDFHNRRQQSQHPRNQAVDESCQGKSADHNGQTSTCSSTLHFYIHVSESRSVLYVRHRFSIRLTRSILLNSKWLVKSWRLSNDIVSLGAPGQYKVSDKATRLNRCVKMQ